MNTMVTPESTPGRERGKVTPAKDREGVGAQILGGLDHLGVDFLQNGEDGQNHERQEVVDHAQHDGPLGVDHLEGADTKQAQKAVDQPRFSSRNIQE